MFWWLWLGGVPQRGPATNLWDIDKRPVAAPSLSPMMFLSFPGCCNYLLGAGLAGVGRAPCGCTDLKVGDGAALYRRTRMFPRAPSKPSEALFVDSGGVVPRS